MNILCLGRHLRLGEMLISITIVLWSATPSTALSFLIKGALYIIWCGVNRLGDSGVKVV